MKNDEKWLILLQFKVFHEAMGYSYAHEHGMGVVACRIGNFSRDRDEPTHPHELGWRDCGE